MILTAQQRLDDALDKLHLLQTGRLSVEVEVDGRKVRYARTDLDALTAYVDSLKAEVTGRRARQGAIGFIF